MHEQRTTTPATTKQFGTHTCATTPLGPKSGGGVGRNPLGTFHHVRGVEIVEMDTETETQTTSQCTTQ